MVVLASFIHLCQALDLQNIADNVTYTVILWVTLIWYCIAQENQQFSSKGFSQISLKPWINHFHNLNYLENLLNFILIIFKIQRSFNLVIKNTHTSGIRLSLLRADLFLFSFTMMSRSHWRDRTTSRHHSPRGGNEWANESVGKKLKPDGGRFRSLKAMYWSLKKL